MSNDSEEWIPLRKAVAEVAAAYSQFSPCVPMVATENSLKAIMRAIDQWDCAAQASYWSVVIYNERKTRQVASEKLGNKLPPSIFRGLESATKIWLCDWVIGEYCYEWKREGSSYTQFHVAKDIEVDRRNLPLIGQSKGGTNFRLSHPERALREEKRGARRKWDWEGAICEILAHANYHPDGLPDGYGAQAEIGRMLANWFRIHQDGEPAPSEIGTRAAKIMQAVESHRKL